MRIESGLKKSTYLPMLAITWEQIMDLIGSVKYIENRLGERKPSHGGGKSAQKNTHGGASGASEDQADTHPSPAESDTRLGRKVDTTA